MLKDCNLARAYTRSQLFQFVELILFDVTLKLQWNTIELFTVIP